MFIFWEHQMEEVCVGKKTLNVEAIDVQHRLEPLLTSCFGIRPIDGLLLIVSEIEARSEIKFGTTYMRERFTDFGSSSMIEYEIIVTDHVRSCRGFR